VLAILAIMAGLVHRGSTMVTKVLLTPSETEQCVSDMMETRRIPATVFKNKKL
jgi:hypothetical protein